MMQGFSESVTNYHAYIIDREGNKWELDDWDWKKHCPIPGRKPVK